MGMRESKPDSYSIEIRCRDYTQLRRRIHEQEALHKAILSDPKAPRFRSVYHIMRSYDGTLKGIALIKPRIFAGYRILIKG